MVLLMLILYLEELRHLLTNGVLLIQTTILFTDCIRGNIQLLSLTRTAALQIHSLL